MAMRPVHGPWCRILRFYGGPLDGKVEVRPLRSLPPEVRIPTFANPLDPDAPVERSEAVYRLKVSSGNEGCYQFEPWETGEEEH